MTEPPSPVWGKVAALFKVHDINKTSVELFERVTSVFLT